MATIEITREQAEAELASIDCALHVLEAYSRLFHDDIPAALSAHLYAFRERLQKSMLLFGVEADLTTFDGIEAARAAFTAAFNGLDFDDELDDSDDSVYDCDDEDNPLFNP